MEPTGKIETMGPPKILSASTLQGNKVTNTKGEDLGKVEAILLDIERARIACVIVSSGRANWFPNNRLLAVPWEVLSISFHDKKFILNVSEETIRSMEGFDTNRWPNMGDFDWLAKVYRSFGREPYWQ